MNKRKTKKAFFFTMDAIIALFILVVGISVIFAFRSSEPPTVQSGIYSFDLMNHLTNTKIKEVNDNYILDLLDNGTITNKENTLFQQIAEFYWRHQEYFGLPPEDLNHCSHCLNTAREFTEHLTENLLSKQFSFQVSLFIPPYDILDDETTGKKKFIPLDEPGETVQIYVNEYEGQGINISSANLVIPTRRIVHGVYEDNKGVHFIGPYLGEVIVWQ